MVVRSFICARLPTCPSGEVGTVDEKRTAFERHKEREIQLLRGLTDSIPDSFFFTILGFNAVKSSTDASVCVSVLFHRVRYSPFRQVTAENSTQSVIPFLSSPNNSCI